MPEVEAQMRNEYLETPPEALPGDDTRQPSISIKQASLDLLGRLLRTVERKGKRIGTYTWYERELRLGLVPGALDPNLPVNCMDFRHVESFTDFWSDLETRARESRGKQFGWRT